MVCLFRRRLVVLTGCRSSGLPVGLSRDSNRVRLQLLRVFRKAVTPCDKSSRARGAPTSRSVDTASFLFLRKTPANQTQRRLAATPGEEGCCPSGAVVLLVSAFTGKRGDVRFLFLQDGTTQGSSPRTCRRRPVFLPGACSCPSTYPSTIVSSPLSSLVTPVLP